MKLSRLQLYQTAVVIAATAAMVWAVATLRVTAWEVVALLAVLRYVVEAFAFKLPVVGSGSLAFSLVLAAILLDGPLAGALVAASGAITPQDFAEHKPPLTVAFNLAQLVLMGLVAGSVQGVLGQVPLLQGQSLAGGPIWLLVSLGVALVLAVTNIVLVGTAISLIQGIPLVRVWRESFRVYTVSMVALALLGLVLAQLFAVGGSIGLLLLVVPFAIARQTFQVYRDQSEAYRATVRSLVAAIEAKDPYTRGHSERVAWYARTIAADLGITDAEAQRIEWAALLHDVGKVAVDTQTLTKAGVLTAEEYRVVREHPSVAADLLQDIDLLSDVIPFVVAHHERLDGGGYPHGLSGSEVPTGARVLAVADCFDAMTSNRSYRSALGFEEAISELVASRGAELDADCVDALLRTINAETVERLVSLGVGDVDV